MRIGYRLTQEEATYKDKQIQNRLEVQTGNKQFAPQIILTPFFENRYHKIADLAERCCLFCGISTSFCGLNRKINKFTVLHKTFTAFAYRIRAPPSEV